MGITTFTTTTSWSRPSFTSLTKEKPTQEPASKYNSISSLVEAQVNESISKPTTTPRFNSVAKPRFKKNSISSLVEEQVNHSLATTTAMKPRFKKNSISSLVEEQVSHSPPLEEKTSRFTPRFKKNSSISSLVESTMDEHTPRFSKNNSISSLVEEQVSEGGATEEATSHPRFSMFGKKANLDEINNRSLEQDQKAIEDATAASKKKRFSGKFEYHKQKKRKVVQFNPVFLERVCLFLEEQSPCELKEAHDKQLSNPPFRIICSHWPSQDSDTIVLNKKSFSISPDNSCIHGKLMIRNLALDKSVLIRYTFDAWTTVRDVDATFFGPNPKNPAYDIYEFTMDLDHRQLADRGEMRGKLEFAVRCTMGDDDYWDNNDGKNYQIKILADPLNDPWKQKQPQVVLEEEEEDISTDEEEVDDTILEETEKEKHSQFANALKGYKHAKPYHLNRRLPWLGTRYDFGQSLYLAKVAPYDTWTPALEPDPAFIADLFPEPIAISKDTSFIENDKPTTTTLYPPTSISAPPSPNASPTSLPSNAPNTLEFNSAFYKNLLNKYCFYTSNDDQNNHQNIQSPLQPFIQEQNSPFQQL